MSYEKSQSQVSSGLNSNGDVKRQSALQRIYGEISGINSRLREECIAANITASKIMPYSEPESDPSKMPLVPMSEHFVSQVDSLIREINDSIDMLRKTNDNLRQAIG